MQLVWDWRLARVYDAEHRVVDECIWSGERLTSAVVERLTLLMNGRMTSEARTLAERFPDAKTTTPTSIDSWPNLDEEETSLLQDASLILAEQGVADTAADSDFRLEHLVRALDEARTSHNSLESSLVEWVGLFLPTLDLDLDRQSLSAAASTSSDLLELAASLDIPSAEVELGSDEWAGLHALASTTMKMAHTVDCLERAVRELANTHLPSVSILLGPLLAAKMCSAAHGRKRLARLPASTIQILGAEKAFFSHLRHGTSSPKHGHIFQHSWICRSPKWTRGPIARMLAGKVSIAARIDQFGGDPWTSKQVAEVEKKVGEIRTRRNRR